MNYRFLLVLSILVGLIQPAFCQLQNNDEKEWLNERFNRTTFDKASYYRIKAKNLEKNRIEVIYFLTGEEKRKVTYVGGKREGEFSEYHANGHMALQGWYKEDYLTGKQEMWYANGKLMEQGYYEMTERVTATTKYPYAQYIMTNFWDSTGVQLVKDGIGDWYNVHKNGKILERGKIANGKREGEWLEYDTAGVLRHKDFFSAGELVRGEYYAPTGKMISYDKFTPEQMPEYPGGMADLFKFIANNIRYPREARIKRIEGTVVVAFIVDSSGDIQEVEVQKGIGGGCDEEAMRVISSMPKWEPGIQRGKAVSVRYSVPIKFSLGR